MLSILAQVPLFHGLPPQALATLAERSARRSFPAGTFLARQRESGTSLYVVLSGMVRVERRDRQYQEPLVLAVLGPGEVVGEMAVLDGAPRSATVIAIEDCETLEITSTTLLEMIAQYPSVSVVLLQTLSRRLRNTEELMEHLVEHGSPDGPKATADEALG